jgi:lysophospholipase L1-like esterase
MNIRWARVPYMLLLPFLFLACSKSDKKPKSFSSVAPTANSKPGVGNIEVIGDSLAFGTGSSNPSFYSPAGCLDNNAAGRVETLAVPGTTSDDIEKTLASALAENPKLIFISAGGNDAIHDALGIEAFPASKTLQTMERIFDRAVASGALVVYLGLNPGLPGSERMPQISDLARSRGVIVVDGMNGFWGDPSLMSDDYHPNDRGYRIMCERIITAITGDYP